MNTNKNTKSQGGQSTASKQTGRSQAKNSQPKSTKSSTTQSKDAMEQFKNRVASELGVNLKSGYNGDLTSREAGSVGGEMVRRMIKNQEKNMK